VQQTGALENVINAQLGADQRGLAEPASGKIEDVRRNGFSRLEKAANFSDKHRH
jgi:hypothetical protein